MSELLDKVEERGPWLSDLPAREPELRSALAAVANSPIRLHRCKTLPADALRLPVAGASLLVAIDDQWPMCGLVRWRAHVHALRWIG